MFMKLYRTCCRNINEHVQKSEAKQAVWDTYAGPVVGNCELKTTAVNIHDFSRDGLLC